MATKINPATPGQSSATDEYYNPHKMSHQSAPHSGMGRDSAGTFSGPGGPHMSLGGKSPDGEAYKAKYAPGTKPAGGSTRPKGGQDSTNPALTRPYDEGEGGEDWL